MSQDAVLAAMLDDVSRRMAAGIVFDFVLVTGDLAYSGQASEYALVEKFIEYSPRLLFVGSDKQAHNSTLDFCFL